MNKKIFIISLTILFSTVLVGCSKTCDICKNTEAVYEASFKITESKEYLCEECYQKMQEAFNTLWSVKKYNNIRFSLWL